MTDESAYEPDYEPLPAQMHEEVTALLKKCGRRGRGFLDWPLIHVAATGKFSAAELAALQIRDLRVEELRVVIEREYVRALPRVMFVPARYPRTVRVDKRTMEWMVIPRSGDDLEDDALVFPLRDGRPRHLANVRATVGFRPPR